MLSGCKDDNQNPGDNSSGGDGQLILTVSKDSIKSDSRDKASFVVMFGESDVTEKAEIIGENGTALKNDYFTSRTPGKYSFTARYTSDGKEYVSNSVSVTVNSLELIADLTEVPFGSKVTFTVKYLDLDVTSESTITNVTFGETLENGYYTVPNYMTEVEFQATYSGMESETVSISVVAPTYSALRLKQSKARVAEGETVKFNVELSGRDVTSSATITNVTTGETVSGDSFTYNGNGEVFQFQAEYDGQHSQVVSVSSAEFYKKVMVLDFTSVFSSACLPMQTALEKTEQLYPDRMTLVSCHHPLQGNDPLLPDSMYLYQTYFDVPDLPTTYFDYYENKSVGATSSTEIIPALKRLVQNQTYAGISAESVIKGSSAELTVNVTASRNKELQLCVMVLENGIEYEQAGTPKLYKHNNVLRHLATDIFGLPLGTVDENQQVTRTLSLNLSRITAPENCTVVCAVLVKSNNGDYWTINNVTELYLDNGYVDYRFE